MSINSLDRDTLLRQMAQMKDRIKRLENTLQGQEISGVKIKNLKWDRGAGGNLRLGGENDIDGSLEVYDSFNQLKALLNKNGLAFSDGSNNTAPTGPDFTVTSSTPTDITNASFNFTLTGAKLVLILFTGCGYIFKDSGVDDYYGNGIVRVVIDGVNSVRGVISGGIESSGDDNGGFRGIAAHKLIELESGEHTIKAEAWVDSSGTSPAGFRIYQYQFSVVDLGASL